MKPRHGLVIGKFYPPHAGHKLLVRAAARACEHVTVVVMAATHESIPLENRVRWMRAIHGAANIRIVGVIDDVPVDYTDPDIWSKHVTLMQHALDSSRLEGVAADHKMTQPTEYFGQSFRAMIEQADGHVHHRRALLLQQ